MYPESTIGKADVYASRPPLYVVQPTLPHLLAKRYIIVGEGREETSFCRSRNFQSVALFAMPQYNRARATAVQKAKMSTQDAAKSAGKETTGYYHSIAVIAFALLWNKIKQAGVGLVLC